MVLPRHFVNLLDSMKSMNPAEAMSKRSSCWNSMIVQALPKERGSQSCKGFSSNLWSDVAFDHWPTHMCDRALRRAYLMTGQECLRATAQPRRDEDRVHVLMLPRSPALLHWPLPPLWCSSIFEEFPVHLSLDPFCSACAKTLRKRPSGFFEEGAGITQASAGKWNVSCAYFPRVKRRGPMCLCGRTAPVSGGSSCVLSSNFGAHEIRS